MRYYVDAAAAKGGDGSEQRPFDTIGLAADKARAGDEVLVLPGIYRENVCPRHGGREDARIVYRSVQKHAAVITGSEVVTDWERVNGNVWLCRVPNGIFSERNPFTTRISGDWFIASIVAHTGDVYLNGKSMYEVSDLSGVTEPKRYVPSHDGDFSLYTWYTAQDEDADETLIWANFGGEDPRNGQVEISVRKSCFAPEMEGLGYITLSGFTVCHAATQWAPPTAYQEGMIAPHWSRNWIIEDCHIFESKCSGISLGKYLQSENDNKWLHKKLKDGTQTERECILLAWREGWSKKNIGHHIVRRCHIHDCGQTGIVGHLGGVFSLIEDNHIHHINVKHNLAGAEIGGIKMHAAIDCVFRRNHIHHCTRGMWLDWQAQGTRVTQCLFHNNSLHPEQTDSGAFLTDPGEDIFVEVSHGPTLIDNCLLLSERSVKLATQGVALVNNLVAGSLCCVGRGTDNGARSKTSPRYTPYHVPHETDIAGFMTILHGDMRFYNNLFVQQRLTPTMLGAFEACKNNEWDDCNFVCGTFLYDDYPTRESWDAQFEGYCGMGSPASDRYYMKLPVMAGGNAYFNGAKPMARETDAQICEGECRLKLTGDAGKWTLEITLPCAQKSVKMMDTEALGEAFEPEEKYENPDGTPITFDTDYFGLKRETVLPGPFAADWSRVVFDDGIAE